MLEDAGPAEQRRTRHPRGHQRAHVERHRGRLRHPDLHEGAGVGAEARQRRTGAAGVELIRVPRVVVVARIQSRERGRRVVVEDQRLAGVGREVDDDVGAFRRSQQQFEVRDVPRVERQGIAVPEHRLVGDDHGPWQEAAFGANHHEVRTNHRRIRRTACPSVLRPVVRKPGTGRRRDHLHFRVGGAGRAAGRDRRVGLVELQVPEPVVGRVQNPEPVGLRIDRQRGIEGPVDHRRVEERLGAPGGVGRARNHEGLQRIQAGSAGAAVVVRILNRAVRDARGRREEPGAVVPAARRVVTRQVVGVLGRLVDVRPPEVARHRDPQLHRAADGIAVGAGRPCAPIPGGILDADVVGIDEGLVLDDERNPVAEVREEAAAADERLLGRVRQQVARGLAGVDVQARDAHRVVVIEHQPRALVVGVVEGLRTLRRVRPGVGHVGHVVDADAVRVAQRFTSRRNPLVRRAVADPRRDAAVQVDRGAVLRVAARGDRLSGARLAQDVGLGGEPGRVGHAGAWPRPDDRRVHREEEVARGARGQSVGELDADRPALLGDDQRPQVVELADRRVRRVGLPVPAQPRGRQVAVHLLGVFAELDFVVVRAGVGRGVGNGDRDVLPEVVRTGRGETRQPVHELPDAAGKTGACLSSRSPRTSRCDAR